MKNVFISCEHIPASINLRISENNLCCIQCGLIQIALSPMQAAKVSRHCHCMLAKLQNGQHHGRNRVTMTIDPSQLDLRGEYVTIQPVGWKDEV